MYIYQKINPMHIFPVFAKLKVYHHSREYIKLCDRSGVVYVIMCNKISADVCNAFSVSEGI